jgi:hypothetical protein
MRWVLQFLEWQAEWWEAHLKVWRWQGLDVAVMDGLGVYAMQQAALHCLLSTTFMTKWDMVAVKAARNAAKKDDEIFCE